MTPSRPLTEIVAAHEAELLADWMRQQRAAAARRDDLIREADLREQCREFLALFGRGVGRDGDGGSAAQSPAWEPVRDMLRGVSETRAQQGFTPTEVATFVFSLKQPLFARLRAGLGDRRAAGRRRGRRRPCSTGSGCTRSRSTSRPARR